jgi:hypothetical protein
MTPQAFLAGLARLETFFRQRLAPKERIEYQKALAALSDEQWDKGVSYALATWKFQTVPRPGNFLEWCGVSVASPAEEQVATVVEGVPLVGGEDLDTVLQMAKAEGLGPLPDGFWDEKTEEAFGAAMEKVLPKLPQGPNMSTAYVLARIEEIAKAKTSLERTERSPHAAPNPDDHDTHPPGDDGG